MTKTEPSSGAVLIVAPLGKDAILAAQALEGANIPARACADLDDAARSLGETTTALLIEEEALVASKLPALLSALQHQPAWSDIPVIVLTNAGGSSRMSLEAVNLFGPAGNVTLLERPLHGVTLISALKVALRARQRQYEVRGLIRQRETILAGISDAFSSIDRDWRYVYVNARVAELAECSREELIGRNIWEVFPEAIGSEFYQLAHIAMNERRAVQGELFHEPWGRWFDTRIYPTEAGIIIFRADITERREHEALAEERGVKLQESEALLRLAIEAADAGTFDYYPLTGQLRFSERCKELFCLPPGAAVTYDSYINAIHPEDREIVHETVRGVIRAASSGRYDIEYRAGGTGGHEERWIAEKGRAIFDESGRASRFIGTMLDVTERKNAELALQRAKQQAEEANRAKDQFLAMLSHELRTPLTPVLMTIASLRRQPNLSDDLHRDLEMLQRNIELEALLIDDLLDLTRIAHGKLELHNDAIDIHASLDHALKISSAELSAKQIDVRRHFEARLHHCWGDGARLQQVFWNLVKNAAKFTAHGGFIELRTRNDAAHRLVVEVSDNGVGIDPELLPRIFDAFEQGGRTTTSQYGGLGLGLAIAKRVVDLHGGTIAAASAGSGQGATFTVSLQAMETTLLEEPIVYLPPDQSDGATAELLLVEDHADTARVLLRILESAGYQVAHASSITAAAELARERRFDLLVSDLGLPDGSGLELMRTLQSAYGLRGIALSGFGTDDDRAASAAAGFAEHLTKPVDWPLLRDAIERLLIAKTGEETEPAPL